MTSAWHENDELWDVVAGRLFGARAHAAAPGEVDGILALLDLTPGASILDLCCGVGRHALEFARRGFAVTGVDRTEAYLASGRERATREGLDVELVCEDMRAFRRPEAFDAIVNWFTSFGYFESDDDERRVIDNVFASLRGGGKFVVDILGREIVERNFQPRIWFEIDDVVWLEEREPIEDGARLKNRWIRLRGDERLEIDLTLRMYSEATLTRLLESSGFVDVEAFGDVSGEPYDENARRLVVRARKP